jgi:hypothetical protein
MNARVYFAASALFLGLMIGCNEPAFEKGVTVKGKIVKGGQVLKPSGPQAPGASKVEVIFYPNDTNMPEEQAILDDQGQFTLVGQGKGIKPGTYKVAVFVRGAGFDSDELAGAFNKDKTTITKDIPADKVGQELDLGTIDIDNPGT